jgi:ribosomal protein S18 acetylase RimI-like enzyme
VSAWRGDAATVVVSPVSAQAAPSIERVAAELDRLRRRGVRTVLTGALHAHELGPFVTNGFVLHEHLTLLRHDLAAIPDPPADVRIRRAWRRDHDATLALDNRAFSGFWALDRAGLGDALTATPVRRFRLARSGGPILGYAVTGRSGPRGYLQRLAVDPDHHRQGIGTALVADALSWLRRTGAQVAVVNTQDENQGALSLYERCGFEVEPEGLTVLTRSLEGPATAGAEQA